MILARYGTRRSREEAEPSSDHRDVRVVSSYMHATCRLRSMM